MRKIAGAHQTRIVERAANGRGVSVESMIERAGIAIANAAAEGSHGGQILVLVGPGNNGSDGLVAAERLRCAGHQVEVYSYRRAGPGIFEGRMTPSEADADCSILRRLLTESTVVVDALLGIGQSRPPDAKLAAILHAVSETPPSHVHAIAVDIPTGVNADTGDVAGEAFRADETLCMGYVKQGVVLCPGREHAGRVLVVDVGIPEDLDELLHVATSSDRDVATILPIRDPAGNKGSCGRLVVIGGSREYVGAPALVTNGAYRAGAGLVELAIPQCIQQHVAAHTLEAIFRPLDDEHGQISIASLSAIRSALSNRVHAVVGPGLGHSATTRTVVQEVLLAMDAAHVPAAVIDADALNCLAELPGWHLCTTPLILTPHPGELSRLTGRSVASIQASRVDTAVHYASRWGKIVVLKGAGTVIASPTGEAVINPTGGPNLSTAGTGDVLSGIIGGLLAQGCSPWDAAVGGVYLHGASGDLVRRELGDAGTLASDLFTAIPRTMARIHNWTGVPR